MPVLTDKQFKDLTPDEAFQLGAITMAKASLNAVEEVCGPGGVQNAIVHYLISAFENDEVGPEEGWRAFVTLLRDSYYEIAEIKTT
jgi:hypothetical protein